jgi:flagellin
MSITIRTNIASATAFANVARAGRGLTSTFARVSSGLRIASASDDDAGLAIADKLDAQARSGRQVLRNINDGISALQVADGAVSEIVQIATRLRELAVQAANGIIDTELDALSLEFQRIVNNTSFNGIDLLNTNDDLTVQVGTRSGGTNQISLTRVDLFDDAPNLEMDSAANALTAITDLDEYMTVLGTIRANYGAGLNRLESALRNMENYTLNTTAAESRIRDADMAFETAQMTKFRVMQEAGIASLAQANISPTSLLFLL